MYYKKIHRQKIYELINHLDQLEDINKIEQYFTAFIKAKLGNTNHKDTTDRVPFSIGEFQNWLLRELANYVCNDQSTILFMNSVNDDTYDYFDYSSLYNTFRKMVQKLANKSENLSIRRSDHQGYIYFSTQKAANEFDQSLFNSALKAKQPAIQPSTSIKLTPPTFMANAALPSQFTHANARGSVDNAQKTATENVRDIKVIVIKTVINENKPVAINTTYKNPTILFHKRENIVDEQMEYESEKYRNATR